ncbi:MAG TPA: outer membrane lipoprotein-sorting protein [Pyrinomonadaceae bacterium]|jgi:outer membrane lipoprotein-sorting protein
MRYVLLLCALVMTTTVTQARIKSPEELVQAMQKKYAKSWYKTLTFTQKTTEYHEDGTSKVSIWYEALSVPGKLRIDFEPVKEGSGILFVNDTIYNFKDGALSGSRPLVHPLLVLGFDIYFMPLPDALAKLKQLKFDLSVMHEDTWQGRPVYVVGAKAGDLKTRQFWIDRKNLYFVRMLGPAGKDGALTQETQFNKYVKVRGGGWVAPEVIFMVNGKTVTTEDYTDIRTDIPLDDKLFDPQFWKTAHWR